ncbi:MAG: rod shape-determining protein MreC [Gemmatimonadaceae bacterium]|nr:rod shape-determining protein MreC [Chitinophagaceae bacterium]
MRNIFLFIRRFSNFLFFLVLQIFALYFLFRYNKFHEAAFMGVAGELTGKVSERYNTVEYYFNLKKTNEALVSENLALRKMLKQNYESPDTSQRFIIDSVKIDSVTVAQRYKYFDSKVVGNFVSEQNNYFTIHRGQNQGIEKDWGVISPTGIAGRIVNVGPNYSVVMSALNRQFKVNSMLKNSGEKGSVQWDGENPQYMLMKDVPKSAKVAKGDSVITSNLSDIYPAGIMVGTIAEVIDDKSSNFFMLKLKTSTNFYNLQYVTVIQDLQKEEKLRVEKAIKKVQ